jgi:hypothetical protein
VRTFDDLLKAAVAVDVAPGCSIALYVRPDAPLELGPGVLPAIDKRLEQGLEDAAAVHEELVVGPIPNPIAACLNSA